MPTSTALPVTRASRLSLVVIVTCQLMLVLDATVMIIALPASTPEVDGIKWISSPAGSSPTAVRRER
ncbi:hypothetical protein ACFQ1S_33585 [Kibdelosporangium lantanae]|uniref:Major facilitator superfamily (MFS) profile domain-containing protein n=1 Tax=Kibdelosporangium lantanae TaxID=1497396 RepID=A0ABW3MHD3_9PSEU